MKDKSTIDKRSILGKDALRELWWEKFCHWKFLLIIKCVKLKSTTRSSRDSRLLIYPLLSISISWQKFSIKLGKIGSIIWQDTIFSSISKMFSQFFFLFPSFLFSFSLRYAWFMSTLGFASIGNLTVMAVERWLLVARPMQALSIR